MKVNVRELGDVARKESISPMPTFKFYKAGKLLDELKGANAEALKELIKIEIHRDCRKGNGSDADDKCRDVQANDRGGQNGCRVHRILVHFLPGHVPHDGPVRAQI